MPNLDAKRAAARSRARALVAAMTDEEARALVEAARLDDDAPPLDEKRLARMRPASAAEAADLQGRSRGRGRPPAASPKRLVSLRLDRDVIERFRATGPGWQTRINEVLREHLPKGSK
jgi:uncharacterized protein (DUF4415 family)